MARNNDRDRGPKRVVRDNRPRGKKRVCIFCQERTVWVDYKDLNLLRRFMSDRGKIRSRRVTGNCAQHQREVEVAIKTAREVALLPYTQRTLSERSLSGGPRRARHDEAVAGRSEMDGDLEASDELGEFGAPPADADDDDEFVGAAGELVTAGQLQGNEV
jgi:small subunit ribosomal protein S18